MMNAPARSNTLEEVEPLEELLRRHRDIHH